MDQRWVLQIAGRSGAMGVVAVLFIGVVATVSVGGKYVLRRLRTCTEGAATVEFALVISIFLLIVAGIMDFGHAWYMQQVITNASREGARYGITYRTDASGKRIAPAALSPSISDYVLNDYKLSNLLPSDSHPDITSGGDGLGTGTRGSSLEVTVTAQKTWFIVSSFIPGLGSQKTLRAATVMLCE